ncbi:MAG TPA: isoprenylcysteine carboxylmethyltransferase family protein, partial [Thermoproteales archaeon]|nr:isoprenylcysteine carboxylmethyltransferase family protein [Thermoproteales archaeon]
GCYSKVRHPIYSIFGFLVLPGFVLFFSKPLSLTIPVVYFIFLLNHLEEEEKELYEIFGSEWIEYCKKTGRLLPKIKR